MLIPERRIHELINTELEKIEKRLVSTFYTNHEDYSRHFGKREAIAGIRDSFEKLIKELGKEDDGV